MQKTKLLAKTALAILIAAQTVALSAHNNVVVIPLAGDDIMPKAFARVATDAPHSGNYANQGTTTVDKVTDLEWQRFLDSNLREWAAAFIYCRDLTLNGKNDWRLPKYKELLSIVNYSAADPKINTITFPYTKSDIYWTSSTYAGEPQSAWVVGFEKGTSGTRSKLNEAYARCVR
jgi:hypothetical protein